MSPHRQAHITKLVLVSLLAGWQGAVAQSNSVDMVCSPSTGCVTGQVSTRAGVQVTLPTNTSAGGNNSSTPQSVLLLPGTYSVPASNSAQNVSLLQPFYTSMLRGSSKAEPLTGFSLSQSTDAVNVNQASGLIVYSNSLFSGSSSLLAFNNSFIQNATSSYTPLSFLLSPNIYAVVSLPISGGSSQRVAFSANVYDVNELPLHLAGGSWTITDIQGARCSPACGSGGVCSLEGKCLCAGGFVGETCNTCDKGRFGPQCTLCSDCGTSAVCDEGITGTGRCIPRPLSPAAQACDCVNGICATGNAGCTCNPGWADATGGKKCSVCATGYYMSSDGDCVACGPGCTACAASSGTCSTCAPGLQVSSDNPQVCIAQRFLASNGTEFTSCADGTYLSGVQTCSACSTSCQTCSGPDQNNCLSCSSGRGLLNGLCVSVDSDTGICDGSAVSSGNSLAWVYDNTKKECDPLPAGCTAGKIPSFTGSSQRSNLQCTGCLGGLSLYDGKCLAACPDGFYSDSGTPSTCRACSTNCAACAAAADSCTSCPSGQLLVGNACISANACPTGHFQRNSTSPCTPCHPDCASCSEAFDKCNACPPSRPVLTASQTCVATCPSGSFYNSGSQSCTPCDKTCASCIGQGSEVCISCPSGTILKQGKCVKPACQTLTPLGVCLADLAVLQAKSTLDKSSASRKGLPVWAYILLAVGILGLLLLLAVLWRIRAVKKRVEKTAGFQRKKGIFGLFRFGRRKKESNDDAKSTTLHNHIELTRSPTPPRYSEAAFPLPWDRKVPLSASDYSSQSSSHASSSWHTDSGSSSSRLKQPQPLHSFLSHSSGSGDSIKWPLPAPIRPDRGGPRSLSASSSASRGTLNHLTGKEALSHYIENHERQKALDALTQSEKTARRQEASRFFMDDGQI